MHKIVIAVGGTGGHVFPAERLAVQLQEKGVAVFFAGAGLSANRYFDQSRFPFAEVAPAKRTIGAILRGIIHSFKILAKQKPKLVVGFGSYHSFPLLFAALIMRIPYVLFESNALPGKVVRFFSRWAKSTAVQFPSAQEKLFGTIVLVKMERRAQKKLDLITARLHYGLDQKKLTVLVFGGSQGAAAINRLFSEVVCSFKDQVQVIHLAGTQESADELKKKYAALGIAAAVKPFEAQMDMAWSAADIAVCRSGASTVAEQLAFEVPAVFIPFPRAADDHQSANAKYVESLGAAVVFQEKETDVEKLRKGIGDAIAKFPEMKSSFAKAQLEKKENLCSLVYRIIHE